MPKTHRQILEEAMQVREGILKRERERMEQEEAKEYNLEDMMEECEKKERNNDMEEIKVNDKVNHPSHYEGHTSIECIDAMILTFGVKRTAEYCVQNAYKYIWRHENKNGIEDLKKAEWYINKFDELVTWCETKFSADGTIETNYLEIGQVLRGMIKTERKKYEVNK